MSDRIGLFGSGLDGKRVLKQMRSRNAEPVCFFDNDMNKWGCVEDSIPIRSPEEMPTLGLDLVIISSEDYYDEIKKQIQDNHLIDDNCIFHWTYYTRKDFLEYYNPRKDSSDIEIKRIINRVNDSDRIDVFNYSFVEDTDEKMIKVGYDDSVGLYWGEYNGNRLYLKKSYNSEKKVRKYIKSLIVEQNDKSPHRYTDVDFDFTGGVILDAGAAEGNFSIDYVEKADKIVMLELDSDWNDAIRATFSKYLDKIVIINKCLSDISDENNITLDELDRAYGLDFVKMDIEGGEPAALKGGIGMLKNGKAVKLAVCCYHNLSDEKEIKSIVEGYGFSVRSTDGYMVFIYNVDQEPRLVKGVLRITNE